jgi:hypothetical protein
VIVDHDAEWWDVRMARNPSGSIYTCPLCEGPIHSSTEHMLITPDGNPNRRRHAHTECVREAIDAGRLPVRADRQETTLGWFARLRQGRRSRE